MVFGYTDYQAGSWVRVRELFAQLQEDSFSSHAVTPGAPPRNRQHRGQEDEEWRAEGGSCEGTVKCVRSGVILRIDRRLQTFTRGAGADSPLPVDVGPHAAQLS